MKIKRVVTGAFSPTGTTGTVVTALSEGMGKPAAVCDLSPVDFAGAGFAQDDLLILGIPVFGGRVPVTAAKRIVKLKGHKTPAVAVAAYGNRAYEDALAELQDLLEAQGFVVVAGVAAVTEHAIVREIAPGQPDEQSLARLRNFGEKIAAELSAAAAPVRLETMPGSRPYKAYKVLPVIPEVADACTACGLCAENCPVEAIPKEDPRVTDKDRCISCMRCIARCPEDARAVPAAAYAVLKEKLQKACGDGVKMDELFI